MEYNWLYQGKADIMKDKIQDLISKYSPPGFFTLKLFGLDKYKKVIDLGCGNISVVKSFNNDFKMGVDLFEDYLKYAKEKNYHHEYLKADVTSSEVIKMLPNFDAIVCFDVIEHLNKEKGIQFIEDIESSQPKFLAFRTTSDFVIQDEYHNNPYQVHHSSFEPNFFRSRGYTVLGTDGPLFLMVKDGRVRTNMGFMSRLFANLLKPLFYFFPEKSLNYIAIKKFD